MPRQSKPSKPNKPTGVDEQEIQCLSLLSSVASPVLDSPDLQDTIQQVKSALYDRNYQLAFSKPEYLQAYLARWSSGRALAYRSLFTSLPAIDDLLESRDTSKRVICIGAGACGEIIGLASAVSTLSMRHGPISVTAVDCADWSAIFNDVQQHIQTEWNLDDSKINLRFIRADILGEHTPSPLLDWTSPSLLVTLLFTTNELFAQSKSHSLAFFSHLSQNCAKGTLLLIAESAGSFSELAINGKTYPLDFMLDHLLKRDWDLVKDDDRWYRVPPALEQHYPLQIENTHYMMRLYRKT